MAKKATGGSWKKGKSGNPNGRPPAIPKEVKAACQEHTEDAVKTLAQIMSDKKANPSARIAAANSLLDRGWGKAAQTLNVKRSNDIRDLTTQELYAIASGGRDNTTA
jgi:hypothetical protein